MVNVNDKLNTSSTIRVPHTGQIDRRKRTVITGVVDVCSFHETEIVMRLENGQLFVTGQGLHVSKLLPEENRLEITGQIDSLLYEQPRKVTVRWWPWRNRQE